MNRRQKRQYRRNVVANWHDLLGCDYTLGGRFMSDPPHGDCRGLTDFGWEQAGALLAIGGRRHRNVRDLYAQGKKDGQLLEPDAPMKKADLVIYYQPKGKPTPANPLCIRHVSGCEWPDSELHPGGVAISALNPELGVMEHDLALTKLYEDDGTVKPVHFGLAILNVYRPNLDALDVPEPDPDPEPPVEVIP